MSFQALGKFRIPTPHPLPPSSSASPTRVWAEEQRSASPDPTQISTPLHPTLQCLSCVNRRLGHRLNDLWKGNWDSPCLFISVYLPPKILPHFVPESLCLFSLQPSVRGLFLQSGPFYCCSGSSLGRSFQRVQASSNPSAAEQLCLSPLPNMRMSATCVL